MEAVYVCVAGQQFGLIERKRTVAYDAHIAFQDIE